MKDVTLFGVLSLLYYPTIFSFASSVVFNFCREKSEFSKILIGLNKTLLISGFVYILTSSAAMVLYPEIGIITLAAGIINTLLFLPYYVLLLSLMFKNGKWRLAVYLVFSILLGVVIINIMFGLINVAFYIS